MLKKIPNYLTFGRIAAIPLFVALMMVDASWAMWTALIVYATACITDFFDGWLARKLNAGSPLGRFLDPIADKLLVAALLILIAWNGRLDQWFSVIPATIIMMREIMVSGLREFLGPSGITIPVSRLAKWKTTVQMFALGFLIVGPKYGPDFFPYTHIPFPHMEIGLVGIWFAAILTVYTGWTYMKTGLEHMNDGA
ncbi:MAG TPA: CDP-diacylglycerol--glycerol-3-phosphate 3-phosphatidyltransferase [Rhodospirillaceae bacterium]|nr:MAG: CDP-diacylglycerol--glycerol-3-phosphate 3-phosphatidyltransferase [Alphaproteobacteria bacterium GWF2_58_20]HAU29673.1 CDP-diacylglycerol--glycerol-3-phosphate 3-phosphatidyltransferase [Rhodospirillaceae bacterium]